MVTVANGLEVSPNDDTEDDIDFTQAVLDPDTGLMCVYNQGWDNLQKNVRIISTHETFLGLNDSWEIYFLHHHKGLWSVSWDMKWYGSKIHKSIADHFSKQNNFIMFGLSKTDYICHPLCVGRWAQGANENMR